MSGHRINVTHSLKGKIEVRFEETEADRRLQLLSKTVDLNIHRICRQLYLETAHLRYTQNAFWFSGQLSYWYYKEQSFPMVLNCVTSLVIPTWYYDFLILGTGIWKDLLLRDRFPRLKRIETVPPRSIWCFAKYMFTTTTEPLTKQIVYDWIISAIKRRHGDDLKVIILEK